MTPARFGPLQRFERDHECLHQQFRHPDSGRHRSHSVIVWSADWLAHADAFADTERHAVAEFHSNTNSESFTDPDTIGDPDADSFHSVRINLRFAEHYSAWRRSRIHHFNFNPADEYGYGSLQNER